MRFRHVLLTTVFVLLCATPAGAVITRLYPLADIIADADVIAAVKVTASSAKEHQIVVTRSAALKGRPGWTTARFRLSGGDDRAQLPVLETRLSRGRTVLLFVKKGRFALGYVEGT